MTASRYDCHRPPLRRPSDPRRSTADQPTSEPTRRCSAGPPRPAHGMPIDPASVHPHPTPGSRTPSPKLELTGRQDPTSERRLAALPDDTGPLDKAGNRGGGVPASGYESGVDVGKDGLQLDFAQHTSPSECGAWSICGLRGTHRESCIKAIPGESGDARTGGGTARRGRMPGARGEGEQGATVTGSGSPRSR
jgi:hypothetical protein